MKLISKPALKRLMTLWGMHARHNMIALTDRGERLKYFSLLAGRDITSASDLTALEANNVIDALQAAVGQPFVPKSRRRRKANKPAGTAGRHGSDSKVDQIASAEDLKRIDEARLRLDWDMPRFQSWLNSSFSPLRGRSNPQIRTLADANKVWWALKRMLKSSGAWNTRAPSSTAVAHG